MSEKEKVVQKTKNTKVMNKYDIKQKKRKEAEAKAKKAKIRNIIIAVVAAVVVLAVVLSFPIRNWMNVNGTYVTIGGEKVTKVEFAYYYNSAKQDFVTENKSALSTYGISDFSTLDSYLYSEDTTFAQYFSQIAMQTLLTTKSLRMNAEKVGFTYDYTEDVASWKENLETSAAENGVTLDDYVAGVYGVLATWERIEPYVQEQLLVSAYTEQISEDNAATEEEILAEYNANKLNYDLVDYRITIVDADLPATDESGNTITYKDEEIKAAMQVAMEGAKEAVKTVAQDGEAHTGETYASLSSVLAEYLFFDTRKPGDTVVLKDADNNRYLAVVFENRYPDESVTPHLDIIISTETKSQVILDEWKKGAATQESFEELFAKYDTTGNSTCLYTALTPSYFSGSTIEDWLNEKREVGDTFGVDLESGYNYALYYAGQSDPAWRVKAAEAVLTDKVEEFMTNITSNIKIEYN